MTSKITIGSNPFGALDKPTAKEPKKTHSKISGSRSEDSVNALSSISDELEQSSEGLSKNAHRLEKQTNHAATSAKQLNTHAMSIGTSVETLRAELKKVSNSAGNSSKSAVSALKAADSTNSIFTSILESSKEIDKIDKIILALAQQINLFALNASIEAARAGDVGRGFTVVANEIKELSKETTKIAEDIRSRVENFYDDVKRAVDSLGEISSLIISIKNNQTLIENSVEEEEIVAGDLIRNTTSISKSSNSITDNILNVYKLAKISTDGSDRAIRQVHGLKKQISELKKSLGLEPAGEDDAQDAIEENDSDS